MGEITYLDFGFAVWAGVATALWISSRKRAEHIRNLMCRLVEGLYNGEVEIVKDDDDGFKVREVKK